MNERQILQRQGKLCICFKFDFKRLSDSEFLILRECIPKFEYPLNAIILIPYFIVGLCLDASILGFLKS